MTDYARRFSLLPPIPLEREQVAGPGSAEEK